MNAQLSNCSNNSERRQTRRLSSRSRAAWRGGIIALTAAVVCAHAAGGATFTLALTVDTGFFERENALARAVLPPAPDGLFPDLRHAVLHAKDLPGGGVPFWFEPKMNRHKPGDALGVLYWILPGKIDSLTRRSFVLEATATASPPREACGAPAIAKEAKASRNLLPNGSFEQTVAAKPTSTWHGKLQPEGWVLHDFPWCYRQLPHLAATCRVVETEAFEGKKSVCFHSVLRADAPKASPEKPTLVIGYIGGPTVPLEPSTRYEFSYYLKIVDVTRGGYISASVNYLDKDKKRLYPRQYAINRLQNAYGTTRHLPEEYRGRWLRVARSGTTLPNAAFGQIQISGSLAGVACIDRMVLRKLPAAEPVRVTAGSWKRLEDRQ